MTGGHTLGMLPTEGFVVSTPNEHHIPGPGEPSVPELEIDETIAPRPEETIADALRAEPDVEDHTEDAGRSEPEESGVLDA